MHSIKKDREKGPPKRKKEYELDFSILEPMPQQSLSSNPNLIFYAVKADKKFGR